MPKTIFSKECDSGAELLLLLQMFDADNHYTGIVRLTIRNDDGFHP